MKTLTLTLGLLCLPLAAKAEDDPTLGSALLKHCRQMVTPHGDNLEMGYCMGFIIATRSSLEAQQLACFPPGGPSLDEIRVVINFLEAHPKSLGGEAYLLAAEALRLDYPCETKPKR